MPPSRTPAKLGTAIASIVLFLGFAALTGYLIAVVFGVGLSLSGGNTFLGLQPWEIGLVMGSLIGLYGVSRFYNKNASWAKCPQCKRTFAGILLGRELLKAWQTQEDSVEPVTTQTNSDLYDSMGRRIGSTRGTSTTYQPMTVTVGHETYLERLQCRFCSFEWTRQATYKS